LVSHIRPAFGKTRHPARNAIASRAREQHELRLR
jgi:hypothetical protein